MAMNAEKYPVLWTLSVDVREVIKCESAKVNMYKMRKGDNAKVVRKCVKYAKDENAKVTLKQEAQLSQRDRAAACLNYGKNISAKSVHLGYFLKVQWQQCRARTI